MMLGHAVTTSIMASHSPYCRGANPNKLGEVCFSENRKSLQQRGWSEMGAHPLYFRPKRIFLLFLASDSALLEEEVSSMACSTGFWASSAWKTFPAPPRPACWTPLLDRLTTLHLQR